MHIPDDEALAVWNDMNICERFGWQLDYLNSLSLNEYNAVLQYIDARSKISRSILPKE